MSNAGHPNPLFYDTAENKVEELLPSPDMPYTGPVGLSGFNIEYSPQEFTMKSGDVLILYTDGLTEMMNEERLVFNINRAMETANKKKSVTAENLMQIVMEKLNESTKDTSRSDDVSVIILKRL